MSFIIDSSKKGLAMVLTDYQELALRHVWSNPDKGADTRGTHTAVNKSLAPKGTISRASIINFLNSMAEQGILRYVEKSTKGGMKRIYYPRLDEEGFKHLISKTIITNLLRDFPEETRKAIRELAL